MIKRENKNMAVESSKIPKNKPSSTTPAKGDLPRLVEEIKKSNNILITVSRDPSVDALSAALGLTAVIDKMGKHGTAIFSGKVPPAIKFLNPDKIFEDKADSLRDFIIALSRDKADHLRYKVDGDVVKIFVTPYKTVITEKDLEFSQGDYNVELVIALGVSDQKDLDAALAAHGRILHDATVSTINVGDDTSQLGVINLHTKEASSLSEIVADISEQLDKGSDKKIIDDQIATALMTGIVATTERFSNDKTTSRTMAIAATLMAAGADQQLISSQLEEAKTDIKEDSSVEQEVSVEEESTTEQSVDGSLVIDHNREQPRSRLVVDTTPPEADDSEDVRIPTATEILSKLAAAQEADMEEVSKLEAKENSASMTAPVATSDNRTYLAPREDETPGDVVDEDILKDGRISSEQSPSVGAEPLRGTSSVTTVVEPLNPIDPMAPPVVDAVPAQDDLPQFNTDQSAEAILQAALNSASPVADLTASPLLPPPPPPPIPDFSAPPPPLPDFSATPETPPSPDIDVGELPPVMSTLPPEDMILAGQGQPPQPASDDPGQFHIPGQ